MPDELLFLFIPSKKLQLYNWPNLGKPEKYQVSRYEYQDDTQLALNILPKKHTAWSE